VSKSWQSLCLDGQLWSLVHLAPFASHMHTSTIRRIIFHAAPFISSLSLRGMDALGQDALDALESSSLPNLVSLDMRGCRSVTSEDLERIITIAPKLRYLNLKGVQAVSSEAVRCIARYSTRLERLDLSRCWEITLGDIVNLLRNMSDEQANNLRSLRIAGLQSYGRGAVDLLPLIAVRLVNLELLDLHGCHHIHSSDFVRWAAELDGAQRVSPLKHLIISNCQSLTLPVFAQLTRRAPYMTCLEMAGLTSVFDGRDGIEAELGRMLKSMPLLERLDLDSEGTHEDISDSTIDVLIPGKFAEDVALGKELVELRIGYSKTISGEALVRLIRGCPKLKILEADVSDCSCARADVVEHERDQRRDARVCSTAWQCRRDVVPGRLQDNHASGIQRSGAVHPREEGMDRSRRHSVWVRAGVQRTRRRLGAGRRRRLHRQARAQDLLQLEEGRRAPRLEGGAARGRTRRGRRGPGARQGQKEDRHDALGKR
jgi:F-box/leucine-rich repeat protein 2/20